MHGELPGFMIALIDSLIWLVIHLLAALSTSRLPLAQFNPNGWLFKTRAWENGGKAYQRMFRLRNWKKHLPDGAALFRGGFRKKRLTSRETDYCARFVRETCRAELLHWVVFLTAPLFFLWNDWYVAALMIPYAALTNIPCIVTQRFNRPRLLRLAEASRAGLGSCRIPVDRGSGV